MPSGTGLAECWRRWNHGATWRQNLGLDGEHGGMRSLTMSRTRSLREDQRAIPSISRWSPPSTSAMDDWGFTSQSTITTQSESSNPETGQRLMGLLEENFDLPLSREAMASSITSCPWRRDRRFSFMPVGSQSSVMQSALASEEHVNSDEDAATGTSFGARTRPSTRH